MYLYIYKFFVLLYTSVLLIDVFVVVSKSFVRKDDGQN